MSTSLCHFSSIFCIIGANFIITAIFTKNREVVFEVKNLLIDLVRQHAAIYDKSHPE